jgi:hypothetical protein
MQFNKNKPPNPFFGDIYPIQNKIKTVIDYTTIYGEKLINITNARVLFADYEQIKQDFSTFIAQNASNKDIDNFLITNFAIVSENAISSVTKEKLQIFGQISMKQSDQKAYRPLNYGRAIVLDLNKSIEDKSKEPLYVDIKGVGRGAHYAFTRSDTLFHKRRIDVTASNDASGFMYLEESVYEYFMENIIRRILKTSNKNKTYNLDTVRSYCVIDLGFDYIVNNQILRATNYVRQSHRRCKMQEQIVNLESTKIIQDMLLPFGISGIDIIKSRYSTSTILNFQATNDIVNVTENLPIECKNIYLFDFGHLIFINSENFNLLTNYVKDFYFEGWQTCQNAFKDVFKNYSITTNLNTYIDNAFLKMENFKLPKNIISESRLSDIKKRAFTTILYNNYQVFLEKRSKYDLLRYLLQFPIDDSRNEFEFNVKMLNTDRYNEYSNKMNELFKRYDTYIENIHTNCTDNKCCVSRNNLILENKLDFHSIDCLAEQVDDNVLAEAQVDDSVLTEAQVDDSVLAAQIGSGDVLFKNKYIKYKVKYLNLLK